MSENEQIKNNLKAKKFDVVQYQKVGFKRVFTGVVCSINRVDGYAYLCALDSGPQQYTTEIKKHTREFYSSGIGYVVHGILCSGLDNALSFVQERANCKGDEELHNWLKGCKLRRMVKKHRKKRELLLCPIFQAFPVQGSGLISVRKVGEQIIDDVKICTRRISHKGVKIKCRPYTTETCFHASIGRIDLDKDLRVVDRHELLTSSSSFGRLFGVDPSLEWFLKVQEKFEANVIRVLKHTSKLIKRVRSIIQLHELTPSGTPREIKDLVNQLMMEELGESTFIEEIEHLERRFALVHKRVLDRLKSELKQKVEEKADESI